MIRTHSLRTLLGMGLAMLSAVLFDGCANGGGGVDVPNSIHPALEGQMTGDSGCSVARSQIRIRPVGWNPIEATSPSVWNTTSSNDGAFRLSAPDTGNWVLEARDTVGDCGTIRTFASTEFTTTSNPQRFAVRLQKSADLSGTIVPAPENSTGTSPTRWAIVVPGLDQSATPDSQGVWILEDVPAGTLAPTAIATTSPVRTSISLGTVSLDPGERILLPPVVVKAGDTSRSRSAIGIVLTESGMPSAATTVILTPLEPGWIERFTRTDDSGRFALALPDSGTWALSTGTTAQTFSDTLTRSDLAGAGIAATLARLDTLRMVQRPSPRLAIDDWEPREDGLAIPSFLRQGPQNLDQAWLGYSDGRVYLSASTARTATPTWIRLDSAFDGHSSIVDVTPGLAVTAIAPLSTNDGYSAYVAFAGNKQGGKFWKVDYSSNGLAWTDLTSKLSVGDIQNIQISSWSSIVYVLASGTLWYSVDYGESFTTAHPANDPYQPPVDTGVSALRAFARNPDPYHDQLVAGTLDGQIWSGSPMTPPHTPTWKKLSPDSASPLPANPVTSIVIDQRDTTGRTLYATFGGRAGNGLWVTRDGGQNWSSIHNQGLPPNGLDVASISVPPAPGAKTLYTYTDVGTYRSDDDGATWTNKPRKAAAKVQ